MIKKILLVGSLLFLTQIYAQQGSASPYSYFGIGDIKFDGTVENRSMGGLTMFTDSIHMNIQNPSGFGRLKLTNYTLGGSQRATKFKSDTASEEGSTTTFDYLGLGFPIGKKAGAGFGFLPYTAVGYKIESQISDNIIDRYSGEGGLNKVFVGAGYEVTDGLSVGFSADFNFGKIENKIINIQEGLQFATRELNISELSGFGFNIGASYHRMINEKLQLISSLTFAPKTVLTSINERRLATVTVFDGADEFVNDEFTVDLRALGLFETDFNLPSRTTIGVGISEPKKWFAGIEYEALGTGELSNRTFSIDNVDFSNGSTIKAGGYYIPKYNSITSYFKRMVYRAGVRFEDTGLSVNNEQINEFGMSFGVGLPVGNWFSNANIGFEYGQRGTQNSNLVKETFFNIHVGLSFNDKWFQKSKIN
ncbi:MAG: hypothetical protein HRT68_00735 [Flavobacteriaceae bacterium]|nr:hypothetical protein [Flavobacteriaceae bacterium]